MTPNRDVKEQGPSHPHVKRPAESSLARMQQRHAENRSPPPQRSTGTRRLCQAAAGAAHIPTQQHCINARGVPWLMDGRGIGQSREAQRTHCMLPQLPHAHTHRPVQAAVLFAPPGYQQSKAHSISSAVGQDMSAQRTKPPCALGRTRKGSRYNTTTTSQSPKTVIAQH